MIDAHFVEIPNPPPAKQSCWKKKAVGWLLILLLVAVATLALTLYLRSVHPNGADGNADITQLQQRLTVVENEVRTLDGQVGALSTKPSEAAPLPSSSDAVVPSTTSNQASTPDIARMQSDLVALSSALSALQTEVKQTGSNALQSRQATQSSLAAAIAFVQLRETVLSGAPFTAELAIMREATKGDSGFQDALLKLDTYAGQGVPTLATLENDLLALESGAAQAVERNNAETWEQKLLAEFKGLVSIRKRHGGDTDAFATMESDLAKGDLHAAREALTTLPPEAQQALAEWRTKADARQAAEDALHSLADHFTALTAPPAAPEPTPAAPKPGGP